MIFYLCVSMLRLMTVIPVNTKFNNLVQFNPSTMTWASLTSSIQGAAPCPRDSHGFASLEGKVYVFGGNGSTSRTPTGSMHPLLATRTVGSIISFL